VQEFEAGRIYWRSGGKTFAVPSEVMKLIERNPKTRGRLVLPVTEEQPFGEDKSDRIQFFDNGVVTRRAGKYEVWLRPDTNR
jgi:ABC-type polar amino acid transport system ATPase subunit